MSRRRTVDKQALEAKRKAMREQVAARRRNRPPRKPRPPRARRSRRKKKKEEEEKRRPWWLLLLLLLPLLCCLPLDCTEDEPEEVVPEPEPVGEVEPVEPVPEEPGGRIPSQERPDFGTRPPDAPSWIDSFRMQVAARGPRLAQCFVGAKEPGQFKWTTSVVPETGVVSEHALEPMLNSPDLRRAERLCVLEVLENPPYTLEAADEPSTPSRVGIVIEF